MFVPQLVKTIENKAFIGSEDSVFIMIFWGRNYNELTFLRQVSNV
jgi:hypothetical protein